MNTKTSLVVVSFIALFLAACSFQPVTQPNQGGEGGLETQASDYDQLGGPVVSTYSPESSIALDSLGNPVVSSASPIRVNRWNGSSWVQLGGILDVNVNIFRNTFDPSLALDSAGNPVVSWREYYIDRTFPTEIEYSFIYVKRWYDSCSCWGLLGDTSLNFQTRLPSGRPSLALDSSGNPVVSWHEDDGFSYNIYVKRWNGSSWVQVRGVWDVHPPRTANLPSLALDSLGNPVVSWSEPTGNHPDQVNIYVKRATLLYPAIDSSSSVSSTSPSLARRSDNKAVVAYLESNNTPQQLLVKQWNGSNWQGIGSTLNVNAQNAALNPDLKLQSNNNPTVSFEENGNIYVKSWNGSSWQQLGTSLDTLETNLAESPSLALQRLSANLNRPVVAWSELAGSGKGDYNLYVKRWDGSNWVQVGSAIDVISTQGAREPALALLSNDTPVVAWQEFDGVSNNIYVKRWNGTAWVQLGNALDTNVANGAVTPTLAVASDNKVYVGWVENVSSTNSNIYAKYWNGTSWLSLGTIIDNNAAATVSAPSIAMNSSNRPVLSWSEVSGSSTDVLVKTWSGSTWVQTGPILDRVASRNASKPSLVLSTGNLPMVAWQEEIAAANWDVFVSSY